MKELNISCFKIKESTEEKMLKAINELVELQRSKIKQEGQNHTTHTAEANAIGDGGQDQAARNPKDVGGQSGEDTTEDE